MVTTNARLALRRILRRCLGALCAASGAIKATLLIRIQILAIATTSALHLVVIVVLTRGASKSTSFDFIVQNVPRDTSRAENTTRLRLKGTAVTVLGTILTKVVSYLKILIS